VTTLRRIAERVSLAAARAAKSCAGGQQKLNPAPRTPDDIAAGIARRETPAPTVSMQPVWPPGAPPVAVPTTKAPRTRKPGVGQPRAPEVDPAKDQALVNAFADAIKQAASQMGGA
jgi:hypothetical protein